MTKPVLHNVRVLDLTRVVAGPWATQNLADLGADVIKIERPGTGDPTRLIGPFLKHADGSDSNDSAFFLGSNRGKRSVTVDIAHPDGVRLVRELAAKSDVFVENYKTGDLKRYGLDYDSLREINPSLIYCSVTGFGQDGPYASRPAYDSVLQATCGLMSTCGDPEGQPMRTGVPITDIFTGMYATVAIMAALMHKRETGEGQYIDCALLDAATAVTGHLALGYLMTGEVPVRQGNDNPVASPSEVVRTRDGHFMLAVGSDSQFRLFSKVIGLPDLADDPRFSSNMQRIHNRHALCDLVETKTREQTSAHWLATFSEAGVPGAPINDMRQVFEDAQIRHRGIRMDLSHATSGTAPTLRSPLRLSKTPVRHQAPPTLGQHTAEVLRELLGAEADMLETLRQASVI